MTNENCLRGMRCPHCGSEGPFNIAIDAVYIVTDDGVEDQISEMDWDNASYCACRDCGNTQTVGDFYVENADA